MTRELVIQLDDKTHEALMRLCGGDENALRKLASDMLTKKVRAKEEKDSALDAGGLEDYLKSSNPGSRGYGAKGQGW